MSFLTHLHVLCLAHALRAVPGHHMGTLVRQHSRKLVLAAKQLEKACAAAPASWLAGEQFCDAKLAKRSTAASNADGPGLTLKRGKLPEILAAPTRNTSDRHEATARLT